jgi:Bacteriophage tail assembly protein
VNTILGEVFEERGDAPDWEILSARKENYPRGLIPSGGYIITAGVDIQKDRAEVEIVAWGSGKTSWSVDYRIIDGAPEGFELWERLDKLLLEEFAHEEGEHFRFICWPLTLVHSLNTCMIGHGVIHLGA